MNDLLQKALQEAQYGDLRPQDNPRAPAARATLPEDWKELGPVLLDRLFQLKRPIADASAGRGRRLQDNGSFFYLIETLQRLRHPGLEETLLIILDEFAELTEASYDELYLWAIVHLSRLDRKHLAVFWPQAFALDLRYRSAPWRRPAGTRAYEEPYRLTDLIFFYYVIHTLQPRLSNGERFPSLARCLKDIAGSLSGPALGLVSTALRELREEDQPHRAPVYSDALGLLKG